MAESGSWFFLRRTTFKVTTPKRIPALFPNEEMLGELDRLSRKGNFQKRKFCNLGSFTLTIGEDPLCWAFFFSFFFQDLGKNISEPFAAWRD